jgi:mono/diheme cytochrome c family protein
MRRLIQVGLLAPLLACGGDGAGELSPLAQQGRTVYQNVCIACHNGNPNLDGSLGPAVAGASEQLIYARVIDGTYPAGYEPKRPESGVMPQFEYLKPEIPALTAYLTEVAEAAEAAPTGEASAGGGS